jgi:hypothetical protein
MRLQHWDNRAVEQANLFNPAFGTALLAKTVEEFGKKTSSSLPFPLAFLVMPIVLHQSTRMALPSSTITAMLPWIQDNREHLVDFAARIQNLRAITQETIIFAIHHHSLNVGEDGGLIVGTGKRSATERRTPLFTADARDCLERAGFLGRWFSAAGSTTTIYAAWGIRP